MDVVRVVVDVEDVLEAVVEVVLGVQEVVLVEAPAIAMDALVPEVDVQMDVLDRVIPDVEVVRADVPGVVLENVIVVRDLVLAAPVRVQEVALKHVLVLALDVLVVRDVPGHVKDTAIMRVHHLQHRQQSLI